METNVNILNEISVKLGGESGASSVVEALNNIANALGDTDPDVIRTVNDSLNDILEYAGGGGGSVDIQPKLTVTIDNSASSLPIYATGWELDGNNIKQKSPITIDGGDTGTIETLVFGKILPDLSWSYFITLEDKEGVLLFGSVDSVGDLVNCSENELGAIVITDPSQSASCTVVLQDGIGE